MNGILDACRKPPSRNWLILEIVCHRVDEELDDCPRRIRLTPEKAEKRCPSINPELSTFDRKYNDKNLENNFRELCKVRVALVNWLESLVEPQWDTVYQHAQLGSIMTGDIMAA